MDSCSCFHDVQRTRVVLILPIWVRFSLSVSSQPLTSSLCCLADGGICCFAASYWGWTKTQRINCELQSHCFHLYFRNEEGRKRERRGVMESRRAGCWWSDYQRGQIKRSAPDNCWVGRLWGIVVYENALVQLIICYSILCSSQHIITPRLY